MNKREIRKELACILQKFSRLNEIYTKWKWRERKVSYGEENPDKIFFVIRRANCKAGLFSLVMTNMGMVKYALDRGYIPVIDMQSEQNTYLEEELVGKQNAWEYFFEQPCGYTLKDIQKSKNIILSCGLVGKSCEFPEDSITYDEKQYLKWRKVFDRYFFVKKEIEEEVAHIKKELFLGERTLGVLCRGTDYVNACPKDHPKQPTIEQMLQKVREVMEKQKCTWIYLTTEDENIFERFKNEFGQTVKYLDVKRYTAKEGENMNDIIMQEAGSRYMAGKQYLISILLLAGCECLVAGSAGGTYGALVLEREYDYQYIFNLGTY